MSIVLKIIIIFYGEKKSRSIFRNMPKCKISSKRKNIPTFLSTTNISTSHMKDIQYAIFALLCRYTKVCNVRLDESLKLENTAPKTAA